MSNMSKDIRSFFTVKKPKKSAPAVEDDDDIIPESPDVQIIKNKKKDAKKRRVLNDDSDEEIFSSKKKKNSNEAQTSSKNKKSAKPAALKEVKAVDIFGTAPIKRTEPLVKKKKKTELGIHSDDEFEKSLLEIDNAELESLSNDKKITDSEKSTTLPEQDKPSSLSSKVKTEDSNKKVSNATTQEKKQKSSSNTEPNKDPKKNEEIKSTNKSNDKKSSHKTDKSTDPKKAHDNKSSNRTDIHTESNKMDDVKPSNKAEKHTSSKSDKKHNQSVTIDSNDGEIKKSKIDNSKRKFAEFIESDTGHDNSSKKKKLNETADSTSDYDCNSSVMDDGKQTHRTKKMNISLNDSVLTDEERHERRIHSAALYKSYLNRSGPKHLGAKEIPEGKPDCLKDCAFVLTGVLDSFEKDEVTAAINKYGGSVKSGVTKKVTHVLAGEDAGPAKMAKAQELGIKIINEDEFLKIITDCSQNKPTDKPVIKNEKTPNKKPSKDKLSLKEKSEKDNHVDNKAKKSPTRKIKTETKEDNLKSKIDVNKSKNREKSKSPRRIKEEKVEIKSEQESEASSSGISTNQVNGVSSKDVTNVNMWVEKHKPQSIKNIIGQHGDASNVKKLMNWLTKWYVNRKAKLPKPSPWAKNDDGGYFKAALLSGPPGVGKTTTVALVCKELGFDVVEFNASDTRNKTLIKEQIGELLTTTSLSAYAKGETGKQAVTKKHVLVMDEVDGMAGNEDRGGLQELIGLIKSASVPIICMCNDRNSQKMRSLVNYCYDLRFNRPRVDQIKSAMLSICFKEGLKIPHDVLSQLIVSANQDVRQTLNLLSMWAVDPSLTDADRLRKDAQTVKKDVKLGPWEAIRKVFSAEEHKSMSINDKSDLFFYDYSLAPLFVQENYLQVAPHCPKHEVLQRISNAADSISMGDLVDARIRRNQAWSLLPTQAMYSSVIPGHELSGHMTGQIQFPGWLGKNSRASKMHRLCQEIHAHTRLSTSGSKSSIFLDYSAHLRDAIVNPLIKDKSDGITKALEVLEAYHLLREDLDSLVELSVWPGQRNPTILIEPKVKAAMTRTYNKTAVALPYAPGAVKKVKAKDDDDMGDEEQEDEEPADSDPENDALIKKKKSKETEKPTTSKGQSTSKASTSKKKKEK